jgi:predicted nuclease of predicted toxin-antitoxin system
VRFLIDAQLPPRLAQRLVDAGHEAAHVADLGLGGASDPDIWNSAVERTAILVTKDQDSAVARAASNNGPVVLWVRIGNTSNEFLIARLMNSLDAIVEAIRWGDAIVELVAR